jgi:hypothetical protein
MTDAELFPFMDTFRSLARVFALRGDDHEIRDVGASYFKALRRFPLEPVQVGADVWMQKGERFPKPAQWIDSIPKRVVVQLAALAPDEVTAYLRAERLRYDDAPCSCTACVKAGISDKPLRFVPDESQGLIGDRIVTRGHWAHGDELGRYYAAKNAFWFRMFETFGAGTPQAQRKIRTSFEQRMKEIYEEPTRRDRGRG